MLNTTLPVDRTQLPLVPEKACSLYTLQGATTDPGLIAHLDMPNRVDDDMKWLVIYVMLSRVCSLACLKNNGHVDGGSTNVFPKNYRRRAAQDYH